MGVKVVVEIHGDEGAREAQLVLTMYDGSTNVHLSPAKDVSGVKLKDLGRAVAHLRGEKIG